MNNKAIARELLAIATKLAIGDPWKAVVENHPKQNELNHQLDDWIRAWGRKVPRSMDMKHGDADHWLDKLAKDLGWPTSAMRGTMNAWNWAFADAWFESANYHGLVGAAAHRGGVRHWVEYADWVGPKEEDEGEGGSHRRHDNPMGPDGDGW